MLLLLLLLFKDGVFVILMFCFLHTTTEVKA